MTQVFHELCCTLVEEFYGPFHGQIFSQLTYYGRRSIGDLARSCRLPIKHVKLGLAGLVQSRLVYHHSTAEGISTYQANANATYNLLRIGRLVEIARTQHGNIAAIVIFEAINLGFSSSAELELRALEALSKESSHKSTTDYGQWQQKNSLDQSQQVQYTIKELLNTGYLSHIRSAHLLSDFDVRQDAYAHLKQNGLGTPAPGKKGAFELELRIDEEVRRRIDDRVAERGYIPTDSSEKKRTIDEADNPRISKRVKLNGDANDTGDKYWRSWKNDDKTVVGVRFDNVVRDIRNNYLAAKAQKSLGKVYGHTLAGALMQVPITDRVKTTPDVISLDLSQLRDDLNHPMNTMQSNGVTSNGATKTNGTSVRHDDDYETDNPTYNEIERALSQLARSKFDFLHDTTGPCGREWSIDKTKVNKLVLESETLRLMGDRLVQPSLRVVRMLIDKGKLDEKTLQEVGLLGAKELRTTLAQLKQLGYIDLQEIPRESQRQPNRTIFLWFHDSERVRKVLLNNLYKALTRLMQRHRIERNKLSTTIEKAERIDALGSAENTIFERWQRKEKWLLGEIGRLDESVAILRDL